MKVIFLAGSLNQGGAESQLLSLANLFKEKGHEVEIFALTDYDFYLPFIKTHKIKYTCLKNDQSKIKRIFLTAKKFAKSKPDLIISYLKIVSQVAIIAKLLSFTNPKLIVGERTSLVKPLHDLFYFNLLLLADMVTVNSISKLEYIKNKFPLLSHKLHFIPNIIDTEKFLPPPNVNIKKTHTKLGFIGRISPEKNIISLVKATAGLIKKGHNISLFLYGDNKNKKYYMAVKQEIAQAGMDDDIVLKGPITDVRDAYKNIDLLCLLSSYEGFSNVLAEALACGIPIIASDIEENRYLVKDGENGFLVDPNRIEDISSGLHKFLNLTEEAKLRVRENNRNKAEKFFNRDKIYEEYLEMLKQAN